ncbi:MAG: CehA/McbA family metallohydrolase [Gemmatimonadota bacterium]|nr:CehA/McbA family metallohydrolase [Gemmatimonadota bacterium]
MISILTKSTRIIAAVLTAISTAPALGQATAQAPERSPVLRYASLNGNIRGELHMLPPVSTGPMSPTWSPDGEWIAFAMAGDIWRVPAEGGTAEQLTRGPWYHFEPDWSPDGSRIAMTVEAGAGLAIAVLEVDGGEVTHLAVGGGVGVQPAWGPEGRFLYFATAGRGMDIHRIEVPTRAPAAPARIRVGGREAVIVGPGNQYQPRVSPQGVLAYMAPAPGVTGSGGIWTRTLSEPGDDIRAASGEPALVRSEETAYRARPDWLPDGSALVYVSDEAGSNDLVLIGADGGNPLRLTGGTSHELTPRVSPDGGRIAFVSNEKGPTELHVMAVSGGARASWKTLDVSDRAYLDPVGRLRATVLDETGNPTPARVTVYGPDGRGYTPRGGFHRVLTPTETHYFRTTGTFEVEVPAGPATIQVRKGLEYRPIYHTVEVTPGDNPELSLQLDRLIDARDLGWYSGDTHVHDLHQGRYGLTHEDFFNDIASEDLRVAIALIHMDGTRLMGRWDDLTGHPHPLSTGEHILQYAQEFRGYFGHVGLAGIDHFITPLIGGAANTPFAADLLNADYLDAAREMGGTGGFMHPFHGPVDTPENVSVSEIPVDAALGAGDFYDVICFWYDELANAEIYYRLLNAGFRLAATGGTDNFSDVWRDPGPGASRTYARLEGPLSVDAWLEAVRERRTFATNGPLLFLTVDGVEPGGEIRVPEGGGGERLVVVEAASITPLTTVEILVNGTVVETFDATERGERFRVEARVRTDEGGWIAARALGPRRSLVADSYAFAQTSPVWVVAGGREYRSEEDVRFLLAAAEAFRARVAIRDRWATTADRDHFLTRVDTAIEVYRNLLR